MDLYPFVLDGARAYANDYAVKLILAAFVIGLALAGLVTVRGFRYMTRMALQFPVTLERVRARTEPWEAIGKVFLPPDATRFRKIKSLLVLYLWACSRSARQEH